MKKYFIPEPLVITTGGGAPGLFQDTQENIKNAISLGSDIIRTNVSMTKDKRIILFSNAVFQSQMLIDSGIASFTLDELKAHYKNSLKNTADNNQEDIDGIFPELEEVLSRFKDQRFNIHFSEKVPELADRFCEITRNLKSEDRILVSSMNGINIKRIRSVFPEIATSFPFAGIVAFYALYRTGLIFFKKMFNDDVLITHELIGASYLANAGLIDEAKKRGIRVYVLNVMKEDQVFRLHKAGVNGYVTNYAALVKRAVNNYGAAHDS